MTFKSFQPFCNSFSFISFHEFNNCMLSIYLAVFFLHCHGLGLLVFIVTLFQQLRYHLFHDYQALNALGWGENPDSYINYLCLSTYQFPIKDYNKLDPQRLIRGYVKKSSDLSSRPSFNGQFITLSNLWVQWVFFV